SHQNTYRATCKGEIECQSVRSELARLLRNSQEAQEAEHRSLTLVCCDRLCVMQGYPRLEPDDGKLSCPVLRGGSGSDAAVLPDRETSAGSLCRDLCGQKMRGSGRPPL